MPLSRLLPLLALLFTLAACTSEPPPYRNLDNAQLEELLKQGVPIVDIRRPGEWKQTGVIKGSHRLTFVDANGRLKPDFLPRLAARFKPDDKFILICRTGNRTDVLGRLLVRELGYTNVYNVRDGITHWIAKKKPVERI